MATEPDRDDRDRGLLPTIHRRRRWLLALAMLTTAAVGVVAYECFETSYEATAYLLFDPAEPPPLDRELETAAVLATNPDILDAALKDPAVAPLQCIKSAPDPLVFLRRRLRVEVIPKTRLVRVSMTLASPHDAAKVVNAVASSYKQWAEYRVQTEVETQIRRLQVEESTLDERVRQKRTEIKELVKNMGPETRDALEVELARTDLARIDDMLTKVRARKLGLEFDRSTTSDRIAITPAKPATRPAFDPRVLVLALAGVFLLALFLFYLETFFHRGRAANEPRPEGGPTTS